MLHKLLIFVVGTRYTTRINRNKVQYYSEKIEQKLRSKNRNAICGVINLCVQKNLFIPLRSAACRLAEIQYNEE